MRFSSIYKIGLVGMGNAINAILGLLFISAAARSLDIASFGKYALLTSMLVTLGKATDFGTSYIYVSDSNSNNGWGGMTLLFSKMIMAILLVPVYLGLALVLGVSDHYINILFIVGIFAYAVNYWLFGIFQKQEKYIPLILINTLPAVIKGITAFLIFFGQLHLDMTGLFAVFSLSICSSLLIIIKVNKDLYDERFRFIAAVSLIKKSLYAGFSQMMNEGWSAINSIAAKIFGSFTNAGVMSAADRISRIFSVISISVFTVLLPKNAKLKNENGIYDIKETWLISLLILSFAGIISIFSKHLIFIVFGVNFTNSIKILNILIIGSAFSAIHMFLENYFYIIRNTKILGLLAVFKFLVFLGFVIVSDKSVISIASAQMIASLLSMIASLYLIRRSQASLNP